MSWRVHQDGEVHKYTLPGFLNHVEVQVLWEGQRYTIRVSRYKQPTIDETFEGTLEEAKARGLELAGEAPA